MPFPNILMACSSRLGPASQAPGRLFSLEELNVGDLEIKRLQGLGVHSSQDQSFGQPAWSDLKHG